jgi:Arc/MetJ-type ribon-helix-helix transcriptional regulator
MNKGEEKKFTTVSIPTPLFQKITERIKGTGFTSVSSYVTYVLREVVAEEPEEEQPFSKEDEDRIKDRLRALGYLD